MIRRTTVLVLTAALLLAGCSSPTDPEAAGQQPRWRPCGVPVPATVLEGLDDRRADAVRRRECATIEAPVDHARPAGEKLQLAITRIRSADPAHRIGSLVYNPGGPGGSGLDSVAGMAARYRELLGRYDLVSWDPRGAGSSTPLTCGQDGGRGSSGEDLAVGVPATAAQWQALDAAAAAFGEACKTAAPQLLPHLGLFDSARDLDLIRSAVGDEKLHYLGVSYGGQLGAAYAELFPERVGRMVLDGPGSPARSYQQALLDQVAGHELGLRQLVRHCLASAPCALGANLQDALATFDAFLTRLDVKPLPTERSTPLRRSGVLASLTIGFSDPPLWSRLSDALAAAYAGQGEALQGFADAFTGRRADGSFSNFAVVNAAVNCLDHPDRLTVDTVRAAMPAFARASPRFGQLTGMLLLTCAQWPFPGVGRERPIDGEGAAPIVVLGNTGDPLGRYAWAEELAGRLDSGVLLRWDGTGHGAYGGIDRCVDDRVGAYLLDGTVPARTHCPG